MYLNNSKLLAQNKLQVCENTAVDGRLLNELYRVKLGVEELKQQLQQQLIIRNELETQLQKERDDKEYYLLLFQNNSITTKKTKKKSPAKKSLKKKSPNKTVKKSKKKSPAKKKKSVKKKK